MASLNNSHHQDGGVILYNGELILLYCDQVTCEIANKGHAKGRIYLTTHRIVFTAQPINQSNNLQSLTAPFYAMFDLGLEQPVFSANYIRGKVRTDSNSNVSALTQNEFAFKLKFGKGGAIEFGKALSNAAKQATTFASQSNFQMPQNNFQAAAGQYYQANDSIYQPNYPIGFVLPTQVFNQVPPSSYVYTYGAPPPYPGLQQANQNIFIPGNSTQVPFMVPNSEYHQQNISPPNYPTYPNYSPQNANTSLYPNLNNLNQFNNSEAKIPTYEEATKKN